MLDAGQESDESAGEGAESAGKPKRKRIHHSTANRAALADFAKQMIAVLLNAPEGTTDQEVYAKAREMAIVFCEDHADLAAKFRLPDGFDLKPRIAELEEKNDRLKSEHEVAKQQIADNFKQRLESLSQIPAHLKDDQITATLVAEPDSGILSNVLTAYLRTDAERVLPPGMALNPLDSSNMRNVWNALEGNTGVAASVRIAGRDERIMVGDWLEHKRENNPPTLAKCTAIGECEARRRVREWGDGKWQKEHVVYWGDDKHYTVIRETRARELAPAAFPEPQTAI